MSTLLTVLHVIVCLFLMLTVLLQSGKGGGMGGAFGGGNAATVFGGSGASTFLRKLTAGAATIFMSTSMILAYLSSHNSADSLEKYGETQSKAAAQREEARQKGLKDAPTPGTGSGSASMILDPSKLGSGGSAGSAAPAALGSGNPGGGASGSAATPAEVPIPAGATDAKPNPATPAGMSEPKPSDAKPQTGSAAKAVETPLALPTTNPTTPAKTPATPEKAPATTAPAPAKTPASNDGKPVDGKPAPAASSPNAPKP